MAEIYVRETFAPEQLPPISQKGIIGWMRENLFSNWFNTILTFAGLFLAYTLLTPVIQFGLIDAVWTGKDRGACVSQNGEQIGACWAMVKAKLGQYIYGRYPFAERWRVDIIFYSGLLLLIPMLIPAVPWKKLNAILLLGVYPLAAFILLTGGQLDYSGFLLPDSWVAPSPQKFWIDFAVLTGVIGLLIGIGLSILGGDFGVLFKIYLPIMAALALLFAVAGYDFGLEPVETALWGGLLVTLVVAVSGIVASLPLGILFALGRRSNMPVVRTISITFIEFWRGVPLITVLFMSSVMLPLFLPEGVNFDKLLRALIGVALFSAAYMAEVVRGGLQAIPKGQYEGAQALGLSYWKMMNLIVLPQALKHVIPGIVNSFIALFKDTTLVLIIGLFDLLGIIQLGFTDSKWATPVTSHTGYFFAALIFWIFCFSMSRYSVFMENKLHTGHKR